MITLRPHRLGPFTMRVSTLAIESGNVFNLQDFEQNKFPFKQRSFEDSIDTFLSLCGVDLLLIWTNTFRHGFRFRDASCPVLPIVLIISWGECSSIQFFQVAQIQVSGPEFWMQNFEIRRWRKTVTVATASCVRAY